jgi:phospholipid/cholesterol/gamma-HCH transport system permease protein
MRSIVSSVLEDFGAVVRLSWDTARGVFRPPFERTWFEQAFQLGVQSLTITSVTLPSRGWCWPSRPRTRWQPTEGKPFVNIIALSVVRSWGRCSPHSWWRGGWAGITAELGSMTVTEQVDAMRALAADPIKKLVVPRVGALAIVLPLLSVLSIAIALFGGMLMAILEIGQSRVFFVSHATGALTIGDVFSGVGKMFFFAIFIGIIACYNGMTAKGAADCVSKATTNTVVWGSIAVSSRTSS